MVFTLAKKDLHDGKFGFFFKAVGTIPVDLKSTTNKSALNTAVEKLKEGNLINLSPEAKRNYTNELLLPFKYGAVSMAKKTNNVIIPYSITGDYKLFSKNLKIVFGKPIDVSKLDIEEANKKLFNIEAITIAPYSHATRNVSVIEGQELSYNEVIKISKWLNFDIKDKVHSPSLLYLLRCLRSLFSACIKSLHIAL